jgi:hypothetical protein
MMCNAIQNPTKNVVKSNSHQVYQLLQGMI